MTELSDVAKRFVGVVLEASNLELPESAVRRILLEVVEAAGYDDAKAVVRGELRGSYCDQDGSPTGKTFLVNVATPFKVIDRGETDHYRASGWLSDLTRLIVQNEPKMTRNQICDLVAEEIMRSRPLPPIKLTAEGDFLCESTPSRSSGVSTHLIDHTRDSTPIHGGVHRTCGGVLDLVRTTETHSALSCRHCNLRVVFPNTITTHGELRDFLASQTQGPA